MTYFSFCALLLNSAKIIYFPYVPSPRNFCDRRDSTFRLVYIREIKNSGYPLSFDILRVAPLKSHRVFLSPREPPGLGFSSPDVDFSAPLIISLSLSLVPPPILESSPPPALTSSQCDRRGRKTFKDDLLSTSPKRPFSLKTAGRFL